MKRPPPFKTLKLKQYPFWTDPELSCQLITLLPLTICTGTCTLTTELLMAYQVDITPAALEALEAVADRRTRSAIVRRIDAVVEEPKKLGKPLRGWLTGFLSLRTAGQRYRVIYTVNARRELTKLPEQLGANPATVAVTRRGKPVLAIITWEDYLSIIETLEILSDNDAVEQLRRSIKEVTEGKQIPWTKAKTRLGTLM